LGVGIGHASLSGMGVAPFGALSYAGSPAKIVRPGVSYCLLSTAY